MFKIPPFASSISSYPYIGELHGKLYFRSFAVPIKNRYLIGSTFPTPVLGEIKTSLLEDHDQF